jgi:hypothetical protein
MTSLASDEKTLLKRSSESATLLANHTAKKQMVAPGKASKKGAQIILKPEHATYFTGKPAWVQITMQPAPAANALSITTPIYFIIENTYPGVVKDMVLRMRVTFSGTDPLADSSIVQTTRWFDRIEWYNRTTGQELARYPMDYGHLLMQTLSQEALVPLCERMNMNCKNGRSISRQFVNGQTYDFYLPMPHHWFEGLDVDFTELKHDIEVRLYPNCDGIFRKVQTGVNNEIGGGNAATVQLNELRFINTTEMMPSGLFRKQKAALAGKVMQHNYLDVQRYTDANQTWNPSSPYNIDLDSFRHVSAGLIMLIRRNARDSAEGKFLSDGHDQYLNLGDGATVDLENVHGKSLMGLGTPLDEAYFRLFTGAADLFNHEFLKHNAVYFIPFTHDVAGMLGGEIDGFKSFVGDREKIVVRTGNSSQPTTCVYRWESATSTTLDGDVTGAGTLDDPLLAQSIVEMWWDGKMVAKQVELGGGAVDLAALAVRANQSEVLRSADVVLAVTTDNAGEAAGSTNVTVTFTDLQGQPKIFSEADPSDAGLPVTDDIRAFSEVSKFKVVVKTNAENAAYTSWDDGTVSLPPYTCVPQNYTPGQRGWETTTVDIDIYSIYHRHMFNEDGILVAHDD